MNGKTYSKAFLWRQRIGFGISDYACNLAYLMVNTYLLIYYTDVAGISAAAAGFMFLITKFFDAFTDYMVGTLIDKTNTRMGRNRPWMLAGGNRHDPSVYCPGLWDNGQAGVGLFHLYVIFFWIYPGEHSHGFHSAYSEC